MDWTNLTGIVLAMGAIASALAFGGVETLTFAPVEIAVVILALVQFWRKGWPSISRLTACVLGIIVAIPLLQLLPLPASIVSAVSPQRVALARAVLFSIVPLGRNFTLTVNSFETQVAILRLVCYLLVFLLAFQDYQLRRGQSALIVTLILLGVFEAVYGSVQYLTGWQYIFTYAKQVYTGEGTGTYINRNHFAGLMEMVLPFVIARILIRKRTREETRRFQWKEIIISPHTSFLLRETVLFAVIGVGLAFSRSRMGIFAAVVGVLFVAGVAFMQSRRRSVLVLIFVVLALPIAYSAWIGLNPVAERYEVLNVPGTLEQDRLQLWRDNLKLIRDYPLWGTGLGTYRWINAHYQTFMLEGIFEHAHNDYMEYAADIGIPATLLLFSSLWVLTLKVAGRVLTLAHTKDKVLAAGCAGAMVSLLTHAITDFNFQIPANAFIFAWIVGTAAALVRKPAAGLRE